MPVANAELALKSLLSQRESCGEIFISTANGLLLSLRPLMRPELVGAYRAMWGEGPIWWGNSLYYVDIEGHKVLKWEPGTGGAEKVWEVGERVGTVVPRRGKGLLIAGDSGISALDPDTGALTPLGDPEAALADNRFNDGKCSPEGRFFAGTISLVKKEGSAALYRMDPDGRIAKAFGGVTNSNGIVWTADARTMFYIDTPRLAVLAFDYDGESGELSNEREAFSTRDRIPGAPDGMAIDSDGNLWIAFCHGSCVVCFDQRGRELHRIEFPCREVTAPAFGGRGLRDLYVTTGVPREDVEETAGRLFVVTELGVSGVPANAFAG